MQVTSHLMLIICILAECPGSLLLMNRYGILSQILLEFITNNAGICQTEDCTSITAGRKASKWVYLQSFILEVVGKFCFPAMAEQFFSVLTRCRRFQILVTNIGPNDLKKILQIKKTFLFKIYGQCLFVCPYQSFEIGKIITRSAIFGSFLAMLFLTLCRKPDILLT